MSQILYFLARLAVLAVFGYELSQINLTGGIFWLLYWAFMAGCAFITFLPVGFFKSSSDGLETIHLRSQIPNGPEELLCFIGMESDYPRLAAKKMDYKVAREQILFAAIRHTKTGVVYSVEQPGRHHHCIWAMAIFGEADAETTTDQGFITTHGRYVDRKLACRIARAAGQLDGREKTNPTYLLFSEDLWP